MNSLLRVHDLEKVYGSRQVFVGVSFAVGPGDRLAVLGASGSGKSTLLRLLAGLDRPTAGSIERAPNLRTGMVFQDLALWPNLSALDNVAIALPYLPRRQRRERAQTALAACRIADLGQRRPGALSIGQQQRVALARAIAAHPQLLLLDEPFSSLDPLLREELMVEVKRLCEEIQSALVLVTHDPLEAMALARSGLVLEHHQLAESGELSALMAAPSSRLLRHFASEIERCRPAK